ncbi:hypothetical protein D3C86_1768870 [compost metagenome]
MALPAGTEEKGGQHNDNQNCAETRQRRHQLQNHIEESGYQVCNKLADGFCGPVNIAVNCIVVAGVIVVKLVDLVNNILNTGIAAE